MKKLILVVSLALIIIPALGQEHTGYKLPETPKRAQYVDYASLDRGFWFAVQATPAMFFSEGFSARADFILGYRTGEFFKLGPGVSPGIIAGSFNMPVYLDLRGNIISQESRMVVPYWSLDAGYTFGQIYKGLYASPTVGVRVGMPRNDFIAGLSYILQFVPGSALHAVGLRIGFEF